MKIAAMIVATAGLLAAPAATAQPEHHAKVVHRTTVHRAVVRHDVRQRQRHCTTRWVNHRRVTRCTR